ncbi:helix-turn-helix domain-containing protein [Saccharothrix sp. 6-C]|uniref:helix-turn-helix domain-containing protein n=1 Tax=Saccharothrix sp. 6-C TaxID=2781735 RepID=UPI0019172138|nr:helix-turn-helix transcriptional regulator [Saccharothrix sp. 6-C]QQQ76949.1 helix-turn-helix domain-containing protein [Saccharothrix sp. 6-C]
MARRAGTSVRSRRLAHVLKKLRTTSGISTDAVGEAVDMSGSKISRIETSGAGIYLDDLEKLLDFYKVARKQRVELLDLARHAEQRGMLRMNNNQKVHEDWQTWADFEAEASSLLNYEPLMIPGLLQTPEYARSIIKATGHALTDAQVDALVASRMARQGLLNRSTPLRLSVIIEQGVLERPFHDQGAQRRQIRHLIDAGERSNITVRVVPTDAELHGGLNGPFVILEYDDDPSLVLLENKVASLFIDEDDQIEVFEATWAALRRSAYTAEETLDYLKGLA